MIMRQINKIDDNIIFLHYLAPLMKTNYLQSFLTFIFCICLSIPVFSQWSHDFSTDDLSDWSGDIGDFVVTDNEQLQLNAAAAGDAYIYRSSTIDFDSVSFSIFHNLDFAPSDNNKSRIYIALDNEDPTAASGYFIEIGENGSDDALKFYYLENGVENFLASATMGAMASEPAIVRMQIDIFPDGLWSVKTNYEGEEFTSLELEFVDDQFSMKNSQFFGLSCKFSASRADKFFYDDIGVQPFEEDTTPPEVVDVTIINSRTLSVTFSEPIVVTEGINTANYNLNNNIGNPVFMTQLNSLGSKFELEFDDDFDASKKYQLTVSGISDLSENVMTDQTIDFLFAGQPELGDLLLSEIIFDPYPGGEDFIEIYNRSDKNIDLIGLTINNSQKEENRTIENSIVIPSGTYLALTEEVDFLFQEYKPEQGAQIEFQELPSFNNDEGNVTIINSSGIVLDSFDYSEDQHFQLIDDTEGVSLERVSFEVAATDTRNWQSAAQSVRYATPGYENSSSITVIGGEESFQLEKETFSPNQDGEDDQLILTYSLEKSGFIANITVHDAAGFKIKELSNNELLGVEGIITWDGTGEDNMISDIGIYIIVGNVFHADGDKMNFKITTVLADFID